MRESVRQRLLEVNRHFYAQIAQPFDATRQQATPGLAAILPYFRGAGKEPLTLLDVGCGNGRFARLLDDAGIVCDYTGVDGSADLLALAAAATGELADVQCRFVQADLADPRWSERLGAGPFDRLLCTATLQHLPGYDLRLAVVREFARLCTGTIILSFWQFLTSERFRVRLIDWSSVGLLASEVEAGDALLPWKQGVQATRYVHQVDEDELRRLAVDAGLDLLHTFRADGKEGDLNLYAVLQPPNYTATQPSG
ncbi:MAG: class I SAM-dependent methyltransferase [Caldilineaceae bacterium]|nr:class I SAM-dependent methyltransferase [Caldilineaceae bacterium]HRJ44432.1 class I SAM-dependent methyltransferase [Caldilineaceae bacterium]